MLNSKPASWDGLRKAISAMPPESIREAITVQLEHQPEAEVYKFLTRTLDLAVIHAESSGVFRR